MLKTKYIILLGVAGSGKSTIGKMLAEALSWHYFDADDFHSGDNKMKMNRGIPLSDEDRMAWLKSLNNLLKELEKSDENAVLACSALKNSYRHLLSANVTQRITWVFLKGDFETLSDRLSSRKGHFFNPHLLRSQLQTLEEPTDAITVDIRHSPKELTKMILNKILD